MLKGKLAVVTGSTSGIGLGVARALAGAGANLVLNGFGDADAIARLRSEIGDACDVSVGYSAADVSVPEQIDTMIAQAEAEFGAVDVLVNNAGIQYTAPIQAFPLERWNAIIAVNLTSVFVATKAALPRMLERNWGRIINIASAHGLVASGRKSAYVASKHGVVGLTKTVALETATTGVTCNAICPGWVLTALVQKQIDARAVAENITPDQAKHNLVAEKHPSEEFITPEQIGALAVFLCSDAAAQLRGQALAMDGGWTAQ